MTMLGRGTKARKLAFGVSAAAVATLLAACGSTKSSASGSSAASSTGKNLSIAYVPGATGVAFYTSLSDGMQAEAKKLGMSYSYQGSPNFNPSDQTPVVNAVCTRHPSMLVVSPTDPVAMAPAVDNCLNAGIPVITTDTTLQNASRITSQITTNNLQGGQLAADFVGQKLSGKGQVAILSISATATTQVQREQGFENELKAKYPNIQVVATQVTGQSVSASTSAINSIMLAHPAIKAVFSVSGTGAEGTAAAFATDGNKGKVLNVGFDAGPNTVKLLKSGGIDATVAQNPAEEGKLAAEYAYDHLTGKQSSVQAKVQLNDILITSADANSPSYTKYFYKA